MSGRRPRKNWPLWWEDAKDNRQAAERLSKWISAQRSKRLASMFESISVEERLELKDRQEITTFCTNCGEEHTARNEHHLNFCSSCGHQLNT